MNRGKVAKFQITHEDIAIAAKGYIFNANRLMDDNDIHGALGLYFRAKQLISSLPTQYQDNMPHLDFNIGQAFLTLGDYSNGFKLLEARNQMSLAHEGLKEYMSKAPEWKGQDIPGGRILVIGEQGNGDVIQFSRYVPLLKDRGYTVTFQVRRSLVSLMQTIPGIDEVVELPCYSKMNGLEFDAWIKLMSLPTVLRELPTKTPYLYADSQLVEKWRQRLNTKTFNIGISWAGNSDNPINLQRSIPLKYFKGFQLDDRITFYSLQKWHATGVSSRVPKVMNLVDVTGDLETFADTAALISSLDLVITVDTAIAHLAGALNKPVGVLLPFHSCWRWGLNSQRSIWYPSMMLFRQQQREEWDYPIKQLTNSLRSLVRLYWTW